MAHVKPNTNKAGQIISYRFFTYNGIDERTGKEKLVTKTVKAPAGLTPGRALKQMQTEADVWEREVKKGNAPDQRFTFKYFIEEQFLPVFVCNGKHSPSTVKFYKDICEKLVSRFGQKKLDSIRSIDIESYLVELTKAKYKRGKKGKESTYSATYVNQFRKVLVVCFNFAEMHGLIEKNPMKFISSVKKERIEVDFLSQDEVNRFLSVLDSDAPLYWKTAMNVLIRCGLRRGELAGLKWSDIDFDKQIISVTRDVVNNKETQGISVVKETKSMTSNRPVPFDSMLMSMLKAWKKEQAEQYGTMLMPSAFIFGTSVDPYTPTRPDNVTQWLARFNKAHGLRAFSPHDLRHTTATLLLKSQVPVKAVQKFMGHSDASTTLKYYAGVDIDDIKNASDRLAQALAVGE